MADRMFGDIVDRSVTVAGRPRYSVLVSAVVHAVVIAVTIAAPLLMTTTGLLPTPSRVIAFAVLPPLPTVPPPRPPAQPRPADITLPAAPVEAPEGISDEEPAPSNAEPLAGLADMSGVVFGGGDVAALLPVPLPPPAVAAQAPVRSGVDVKPPVKTRHVAPQYPRLALNARVEGTVIIEATIDPDGKVRDAKVLRSIPLLDASALDAVRQWEYSPTLLNGRPVAVVMTVTVAFRLR